MRKSLERRRSLPGDTRPLRSRKASSHLGEALTLNADYDEADEAAAGGARDPAQGARAMASRSRRHARARWPTSCRPRANTTRAEPLIEEALRIRRKLYGEVHPDVAESIGDLGVNFGERGDFKQAEMYLRAGADDAAQAAPGRCIPTLAEAMNNLAWALMGLGQPAEAEPLYREALEMKRKLCGDAHPELAAGLNNLAFTREMRGDYRGAETGLPRSRWR